MNLENRVVIITGGKRIGAVRRGGGDDNTGLADREMADPVMDGDQDGWPSHVRFVENALKRSFRERLVGFVDEMQHAPALIVIANDPEECCNAPSVRCSNGLDQGLEIETLGCDRRATRSHLVILSVVL